MRSFKRFLSLLTIPVVALTLLITSEVIHNNEHQEALAGLLPHDHSDLTEWTSTDSLPGSSGNYYLANDVTLTSAWQAPSGTTNLCLNGHYVKQTGNASVMRANSSNITLNLYDCGSDIHYYYVDSSTGLGVVTATEEAAIAGNPDKYGSFTGGYLTGGQGTNHLNIAPCGGAMYMTGGAKVTFENVNLVGNNATFGGCFHTSNSALTIKGGAFVGNTGQGSAINADGTSVVSASDAYITHNASGFRADLNSFTISGKIEVFGNADYDLLPCSTNKAFTIGDTLENTHPMAVNFTPNYPFTKGLSGKGGASNFTSAIADHVVKLNDSGEAYLTPAPLATITSGDTVTEYNDFNSAINAWVDGSTLKLFKDATGSVTVSSGTKTLDLNNHVLQNSTFIIIVEGDGAHLNIVDTSPSKTRHYYEVNTEGPATLSDAVTENYFDGGYITGITNGGERAIHINNGTVVLSGGTVFGNRGGSGAGIAVSGEKSHLVIEENGAVIGNYQYADWSSAGAITSTGTIVMTGGSVRHNSARLGVGGIRCAQGSLTMTGGEIYGNHCKTWIPSGIYFDGTTEANFGGSAKVYDNYYLNVPKDVGICEGDNFINICEPFTDEAKLYICPTNDQIGTHAQTKDPTVMTKNWSTMMGDKDPYKYIKCDPIYSRDAQTLLGKYEVFLKDGEVAVGQVNYTVSFDANGGSGEMGSVELTTRSYSLPENGFVAPKGKRFVGWKISGENTLYDPGDEIIISEDATILAQWELVPVVSFDANGGSGEMDDIVLSDSNTIVVPENGFAAPEGMKFVGWKAAESGEFYSPGDSVTLDANATFVAQWSPIPAEGWSKLSGVIYEEGGTTPVARALVKVLKGNKLLESTFTNDGGEYHLDCPDGVYNIVVEYNELSETVIVEVFGETAKNIELSSGKTQSLVNIAGDEGIAVGGLNQLANDIRAAESIPADKALTLAMNIEQKTIEDVENADGFSEVAENQSLRFYDIKVEKTIDEVTTKLETTIDVLEIVIPYEKINKRGISVYSYHDDELRVFEQSDSKADGTFSLDLENGLVKIYTNKFSSFAIGYTPYYRVSLDLSFGIFEGKVNVTLFDKNGEVVSKYENVDANNVVFEDVAMGKYKAVVSWKEGEIATSIAFDLTIGPNGATISPTTNS